MLKNPILPGFNPDPSIWRVGEDYYIATSTFEWYPGVQIHHSRDLVNWTLACRPLTRTSQLDMRGNPDSCGIWAPCLSWSDGLFWLIYTDVKRLDGSYKDAHNYLVTAPAIEGPWSDPVHLNSSGFDPSLFHDEDGRKWFLNMVWNHHGKRPGPDGVAPGFFGGILIQEYDADSQKLIGPVTNIFAGSKQALTEAPHLLRHDGWYFLCTAEGGTGYDHAITYARSRSLLGPYEMHPDIHLMTTKDAPDSKLQRVGHGQLVETPDGQFFHTFLCSRPLDGLRRSPLGRETGIAPVVYGVDGWFHTPDRNPVPPETVESVTALPTQAGPEKCHYEFDNGRLPTDFQWLRTPEPDRIFSTVARPGYLRLIGRESIGSWFEQSLVARRQTATSYSAETSVEFQPQSFQQMAGLTAYYNSTKFHYLCVSLNKEGQRVLDIQSCPGDWPNGDVTYPLAQELVLPEIGPKGGPVWLGLDVRGAHLQFRFALEEGAWQPIGPVLDASVISDEGGRGEHSSFTGAFVGMAAQDLTGAGLGADFSYFRYDNF